jgi:hypothetical protein
MIYLYVNFKRLFYISNQILSNKKYKLIRVFPYEIESKTIELSKCPTHVLNTPYISSKNAYIVILNKANANIKLCEPYDIFKDYYINQTTDIVFEVYFVNGLFKVYVHPFDFNHFYLICPQCRDIVFRNIFRCDGCKSSLCSDCNIFNGELCSNCV